MIVILSTILNLLTYNVLLMSLEISSYFKCQKIHNFLNKQAFSLYLKWFKLKSNKNSFSTISVYKILRCNDSLWILNSNL